MSLKYEPSSEQTEPIAQPSMDDWLGESAAAPPASSPFSSKKNSGIFPPERRSLYHFSMPCRILGNHFPMPCRILGGRGSRNTIAAAVSSSAVVTPQAGERRASTGHARRAGVAGVIQQCHQEKSLEQEMMRYLAAGGGSHGSNGSSSIFSPPTQRERDSAILVPETPEPAPVRPFHSLNGVTPS